MTEASNARAVPREGQRPEARSRPTSSDRRVLLRWSVAMPVCLHRLWHGRCDTMALDLSAGGCRIAVVYPLRVGDCVYVCAPELAPLPAEVVWSDWHEAGLRFTRTLHGAVLGHLVNRWPPQDAEFRIR